MLIYCDGGCHNTGERKGDGSYAFLIADPSNECVDVRCEYLQDTTNNRTEMLAVINAIKDAIERGEDKITIVSDSGYLVKGYTDPAYLERWITNGWKTSTNKPVQNIDLWTELKKLSWHIGFDFIHIKGHNKDNNKEHAFWNDICDRACTWAMNNEMLGMVITLSYDTKTKKFTPISAKLKED